MPGPAPKPEGERRRRNPPLANTVKLPAEGRTGDPPPWPLPPTDELYYADAEADLWAQLWATPQAAQWERLGWTRIVARYARLLIMAEGGQTNLLLEVRQLEDRIGLTPMAMLRLRWEVVKDEVAAQRAQQTTTAATPKRRRLKAVDGAGDGSAPTTRTRVARPRGAG